VRKAPVAIRQCVIPSIHTDLEVFLALVQTADHDVAKVFSLIECQAIVQHVWSQVRWIAIADIYVQLLWILLWMGMSFSINNEGPTGVSYYTGIWGLVLSPLWLINMLQEIAQFVGHRSWGMSMEYLTSPSNWVDVFRMLVTGGLLSILILTNDEHVNTASLRVVMACLVMFRWNKSLYALRCIKTFGLPMLPILRAMRDINAFCFVLLFVLFGFSHTYYTLGIHQDISSAFNAVYRLGVLGDFDLQELEGVDPHFGVDGNTMMPVDPDKTSMFYVVRVFMIVATFGITVTLLNIFIGVLSVAFENETEKAESTFWHERSHSTLMFCATVEGFYKMHCPFCRRRVLHKRANAHDQGAGKPMRRTATEKADLQSPRHLWYCFRNDDDCFDAQEEENNFTLADVGELMEEFEGRQSMDISEIKHQVKHLSAQNQELIQELKEHRKESAQLRRLVGTQP